MLQMTNARAIAVLLTLTLSLVACGRDDRAGVSNDKSGSTSSVMGSGTSANPTKAPLQTGEAGATGNADAAGGGTTTGGRTTPNPK
jgi:hypothetical protein